MPVSSRIQSSIKIIVSILAFGFIIFKIKQFENLPEAWNLFVKQTGKSSPSLLLLVIAGMPIHWFFEIHKWRLLVQRTGKLSFKLASIGVFSGLTMALFTPNRIGEIVTRVFVLPKEKRAEGIAYSAINAMSQFLIVQLLGLAGLFLFLRHPHSPAQEFSFLNRWVFALAISLCLLFVFALFNVQWIEKLTRFTRLDVKYPGINTAMRNLPAASKLKTLWWSAAKYLTYTFQFFFLLRYFGLTWETSLLIPALMTIYLLLNFIPVISIGEAGVRGSVTLLILGQNTPGDLGILAASLLIWILNIALPAMMGTFFLKKIKL